MLTDAIKFWYVMKVVATAVAVIAVMIKVMGIILMVMTVLMIIANNNSKKQ